jgi:predicted nucleotidyltransferase
LLKLRDRDAILTEEGIIFRVYGYIHPLVGYVCDPEYASPTIFKSTNPRAQRGENNPLYYKFFADEGLKLVSDNFPQYMVNFKPLQKHLVGVKVDDINEVRKPEVGLQQLLKKEPNDVLLIALHDLLERILSTIRLKKEYFGVFGSLLHGFHHSIYSDLDFIIYGEDNLTMLYEALKSLYREDPSLQNEFENMNSVQGKDWKFLNYSLEEYVWHQRRKMIYAYFDSEDAGRVIKAEFEPVKDWHEISNEYRPTTQISHIGWIKAICEITDDKDAPFMPSIYSIEVKDILDGQSDDSIIRIFSYLEEFRMQAKEGEKVIVEGNLEKVVTNTDVFHQITLSYGPRYYEQSLKVIRE